MDQDVPGRGRWRSVTPVPRHRRIRRVDELDKTPHELLIAGDGIHATPI
jgi:hypothetical protein